MVLLQVSIQVCLVSSPELILIDPDSAAHVEVVPHHWKGGGDGVDPYDDGRGDANGY